MGIKIIQRGSFNNVEKWFNRILRRDYLNVLAKYGERGVELLSAATPVRTGETAASWEFSIVSEKKGQTSIVWTNSHVNEGVNIAIILQYGHGTRNGGYVVGTDYINPTMRDVFKELADEVWKEATEVNV